MKQLIPAFKNTIFNPTYELAAECIDIGLDDIWDNA